MDIRQLIEWGLSKERAQTIVFRLNALDFSDPEQAWSKISKTILTPSDPFSVHLNLFTMLFPTWRDKPEKAPAWLPDAIAETNLSTLMMELNFKTRAEIHHWSTVHFEEFWQRMVSILDVQFHQPPQKISDLSEGVTHVHWLKGAKLNCVETCFKAEPAKTAIIYQKENSDELIFVSYEKLNQLSNRVALSLTKQGVKPKDRIAIAMSMNIEAIAIYLGIIKMGAVAVGIAESFSHEEIATRLRITNAKAIFTQTTIFREGKTFSLYEKVKKAQPALTIVVLNETTTLFPNDISWEDFLVPETAFKAYSCSPEDFLTILFSSGTTHDPKAIPWNHTTPIKVATDAHLHHNIKSSDILAWPTSLGWMMGPWLIFAALFNKATLAIFDGSPRITAFGKFIQKANVTMLGVIPTLVSHWRKTQCMEQWDWQRINVFSSTGECSNAEDMLYLMHLAGYKPVIEYCGGTEVGGAYITSTVIEKNYPSLLTTPAMGLDFILIDEEGKPTNTGEVAIIPPSLGLSNELLNADHNEVYYQNMPCYQEKILRRHGDLIHRFENGLYCMLGRIDDTMKLGGIKVSSAEIERTLVGLAGILEVAAIAISEKGPSQLVIFAVTETMLDHEQTKKTMQQRISEHLNPLFKIADVVFVKELPKTASNKIMRRLLRQRYR